MNIDATFLPIAVDLINEFATPVTYIRSLGGAYDPSTGEVTASTEQYAINAGIISRSRVEEGGVGETYSLTLWIQHSSTGVPHLPTTSDSVVYDNTTWKVVNIEPTYSSKDLIASKLVARAD